MTHSSAAGMLVLGWDIGGANIKAVLIEVQRGGVVRMLARSVPFAMEDESGTLGSTLRRIARGLGIGSAAHAVTMTAELSQAFRTKREGVGYVLDALSDAFPDEPVHVYTVDGKFIDPADARREPLSVAASNWLATARFVAREEPMCVLLDIGTTTTDITPIVHGEPAAIGRTDPERLLSGELVYTGALRTPVEAVALAVPLWGGWCPLAAERFALMGDVYLWLGTLDASEYTVPAPDGRPPTREFAGERLARAVCSDAEMLDEIDVGAIARALAEAQLAQVEAALRRVLARHEGLGSAIVAGLGEFIATEAARRVGLDVSPLSERLGDAARTAPAAAVAWLLAETAVVS